MAAGRYWPEQAPSDKIKLSRTFAKDSKRWLSGGVGEGGWRLRERRNSRKGIAEGDACVCAYVCVSLCVRAQTVASFKLGLVMNRSRRPPGRTG